MRKILTLFVLSSALTATGFGRARTARFTATAYSDRGTTASGEPAHKKVAAADPAVLPLGSKVQVTGAGPYSGTYKVADTGSKVNGKKIDLFIPNTAAAKQFGKKPVEVKVLSKPPATSK